jgi:RNA recognition motif. (a.k.a. RRM, RBD, or RNP domain)
MPVKLFVGGLSFSTSNDGLRTAFARYGMVESAVVMMDRETGRSRGFGFVEMATSEEADRAIGGMNGASLDGRTIRVDKATPRGTGGGGFRGPGGPPRGGGGFADRRPPAGGGGFGERRPSGGGGFGDRRPSGGFGDRPSTPERPGGWGDRRPGGGGLGDQRGNRRRGDKPGGGPGGGEKRTGPGRGRSGRPTNERRAGDRGRRSGDDTGRWGR